MLGCAAAALVAQGLGTDHGDFDLAAADAFAASAAPALAASIPRMPRPASGSRHASCSCSSAGACLLSVVMHWPLVLHLGADIPKDLGDPLAESWQVAWGGHALAHQPLHFFQSNQFWPLHDTLAFSDALVGYAPAGLFGSGPHAAVFRYDLLFLFAYALAFAGAYLLARELGLGSGGAAVAGAAFAFAPFRLEQDGHMQVISSGGIPLALALGVRGYRLRRPGWVVAGSAVAAWQLSIGFTLGLPFAYLLARARGDRGDRLAAARPPAPRPRARARDGCRRGAVRRGRVRAQPPLPAGGRRAPGGAPHARPTVEAYSGPPWIFLVAPDENLVWGGATAPLRDGLENIPEKTLFPGLVILVLAIAGLSLIRAIRAGCGAGSGRGWWRSRSLPSGFGRAAGCCGRTGSSTTSCPAGRRSGSPAGS